MPTLPGQALDQTPAHAVAWRFMEAIAQVGTDEREQDSARRRSSLMQVRENRHHVLPPVAGDFGGNEFLRHPGSHEKPGQLRWSERVSDGACQLLERQA